MPPGSRSPTAPSQQLLTRGFRAIFSDSDIRSRFPTSPVLQCLQIKPLPAQPNAPERYRVVLSDLQNYVQTMLATQANHVIHDGKLTRGCIVRVKEYQKNQIKAKK